MRERERVVLVGLASELLPYCREGHRCAERAHEVEYSYEVDGHEGANNFEEMRVTNDTLGDKDVMEDPVDTEILGDNIADHKNKPNVECHGTRDTHKFVRDV